jgi:drug/metabolite transporter (DMT)-like permease
LGERPGARHARGVSLVAVGLICFIEPWHSVGDIKTILVGLGSGLCWGLGTVLTKREFNKHVPDIMAFTTWQMLFGGLAMVLVAWLTPQIAAQWGGLWCRA